MRIMRSRIGRLSAAVGIVCLSSLALAQQPAPPTVAPNGSPGSSHPNESTTLPAAPDAAFEASIERRAGETVDDMKLDDAAKAGRVKELFKQHFRNIEAWDKAHGKDRAAAEKAAKASPDDADAKAKLDAMNAELQTMQSTFFAKVGADLTPAQVENIKNKLVGGRYEHNVQGFKAEFPDLPADEQANVEKMWQTARDEAMPLGTAEAKNAVFAKWKGRVNNYLSKKGFVGKSAAAKKAKAASQSAK